MERKNWYRFLVHNSTYDTDTIVELSADDSRKLKNWCKRYYVYSGNDNINHFLVDYGKLDLFKIGFYPGNKIRVRQFIKTRF